MNTLREAAQQALEALQAYGSHAPNCDHLMLLTSLPPQRKPCSCGLADNITALRAALAEPVQAMTRDESTVIKLQDNEVLRVTAEGEFIWNENADDMIASGDYSHYPALRHILKALRENERLRDAVAAEREACAKVCEDYTDRYAGCEDKGHGYEIAAAIRARGE